MIKIGRWKTGDASWREDYRKVSKTMSIPQYLMRDLEAHGKPSTIVSEILENHKDAIGDGVYKDLIERRRERLALLIEDLIKDKLTLIIRDVVQDAVDLYIDDSQGKGARAFKVVDNSKK